MGAIRGSDDEGDRGSLLGADWCGRPSGPLRVLAAAGLKIQLHPNGTAIEGEWGPVFAAIEACHQAVHAMGCPRVYTSVSINTRTDRDQTLEDKVASVQALL